MAVQDDHMIRNIQDVGRLIAKLLMNSSQIIHYLKMKQIIRMQISFLHL
jgi:hypothetical protein